jgi:hypothetical protein
MNRENGWQRVVVLWAGRERGGERAQAFRKAHLSYPIQRSRYLVPSIRINF